MGTPKFAVPILDILCSKHDVVLVVSQPDYYDYRKKRNIPSPVVEHARNLGLNIIQPKKISKAVEEIKTHQADIIVTAAYGQFVPKQILDYPKYQSINVHGSLLPKYRGGAPIQRAIINGDEKTGISIIYMTAKMDAGDILAQEELFIEESDNQDSLFEKLSLLGRKMIIPVLSKIKKGRAVAKKQDESQVSFAYNLTKEDELLKFNVSAKDVFNKIRGLNSNPGAYFVLSGINIKVYNSYVSTITSNYPPGIIVDVGKDCFSVSCKDNTVISITEIQPAGKRRMSVRDYLNGQGKNIIKLEKEIQ